MNEAVTVGFPFPCDTEPTVYMYNHLNSESLNPLRKQIDHFAVRIGESTSTLIMYSFIAFSKIVDLISGTESKRKRCPATAVGSMQIAVNVCICQFTHYFVHHISWHMFHFDTVGLLFDPGGGYSHRNAIRGCAAQMGRFLTKNP